MSIEKFLPEANFSGSKTSLLDRIKSTLLHIENKPVDREFYNSNKTRKFCFNEWRDRGNFRQLNIHLYVRVGNQWSNAMGVMTRWSNKEKQLFGLELDAITNDFTWPWEEFCYDHDTGGLMRKTNMRAASMERTTDEERKLAGTLGFVHESKLPQFIDFEKTAKEFMLQAKRLNFSNPVLYPKELLEK